MNDPFGYQTPYRDTIFTQKPQGHSAGYATTSLVLGIVSVAILFCCCCAFPAMLITGILAIVFAFLAKRDNDGEMPGKATAGMILGIVGLVLCILLCVVLFANFSLFSTFPDENASSEEIEAWFRDYERIMREAGVDADFSEYYGELE